MNIVTNEPSWPNAVGQTSTVDLNEREVESAGNVSIAPYAVFVKPQSDADLLYSTLEATMSESKDLYDALHRVI